LALVQAFREHEGDSRKGNADRHPGPERNSLGEKDLAEKSHKKRTGAHEDQGIGNGVAGYGKDKEEKRGGQKESGKNSLKTDLRNFRENVPAAPEGEDGEEKKDHKDGAPQDNFPGIREGYASNQNSAEAPTKSGSDHKQNPSAAQMGALFPGIGMS
jgi:hypothetical protein